MHTYTHFHKLTPMHNYKYYSHTYAHIHADNTYVYVNKYIHIPVHIYRDIQIHSFIHEQIKKIFDQNILNRKSVSHRQKIHNTNTSQQIYTKNS